MRLVFASDDGKRVQLGEKVCLFGVVRCAQVVLGCAVMLAGRASRNNVRVALQDIVCILALEPIKQRRVAVEMVEVVQQAIALNLRQIRIGFALGDRRRHLDGHLLVGDGRFKR